MPIKRTRVTITASRTVVSACGTAACWIGSVLLLTTAGFLTSILFTRVIPVPDFILGRLEARFAAAQLQPRFGSTRFDPTGTLVLENVRFHSPLFNEPVASARAIVLNLDFWAVAIGDFDVDAIEIVGLELHCPAMFSPSGVSLAVVSDLHATFIRDGQTWSVPRADFRIGPIVTSVTGTWDPRAAVGTAKPTQPVDWVRRYFDIARTISGQLDRLESLGHTRVDASFTALRDAPLHVSLEARLDKLEARGVTLTDVTLRAVHDGKPTLEPPVIVEIQASGAMIENQVVISSPRIRATGELILKPLGFNPGPLEVSAAGAAWNGIAIDGFTFKTSLEALPIIEGELALSRDGSIARMLGSIDPRVGSVTGRVDARLDPATLGDAIEIAAVRLRAPLLRRLKFSGPLDIHADVQLGNQWRFRGAQARFRALDSDLFGVVSTVAAGSIEATPERMLATDLLLEGADLAGRGSYEMDFRNLDFRFLIRGHTFPETIDPWFTEWWTKFWSRFSFANDSPPVVDLEVAGRWRDRRQMKVAGSVEAGSMTLHDLPFDKISTRLFIRDHHYDVLDLSASLDERSLRGSFTRSDRAKGGIDHWVKFDLKTDLELPKYSRLAGAEVLELFRPFVFEGKPELAAAGRIDFRESGISEDVTASVTSTGVFRFFEFPVENASFKLHSQAGALEVREINADLAAGRLTGTANSKMAQDGRRVSFNLSLADARLDLLSTAYTDFRHRSSSGKVAAGSDASEGVLGGKGVLTLNLEATGPASDIWGYSGTGTASVAHAEFGRVRLLGPLSKLFEGTFLNFSSFKLTNANAQFALEGERLSFSKLEITGPSARLRSFGNFWMPNSQLEFNTTIFPFREASMPVIGLIGLVLEPFSRALEVRLTGSLDKPQWAFAAGAAVSVHPPVQRQKELTPATATEPAP